MPLTYRDVHIGEYLLITKGMYAGKRGRVCDKGSYHDADDENLYIEIKPKFLAGVHASEVERLDGVAMIRFVDVTCADQSAGGPPCCAFLDTVTDHFILTNGCPVFDSLDDLNYLEESYKEDLLRLVRLIPPGFFDGRCHNE